MKFLFLKSLLYLFLFSPIIIEGSSIRLDSFLVYLFIFFLFITNNFSFNKSHFNILLSFLLLFLGVLFSIVLQYFTNSFEFNFIYIQNLQGYLRPFLFYIIAAISIRNYFQTIRVVKILLISIILHGFFTLIHFFQIVPFSNILSLLYRGSINEYFNGRALGAFQTVHSLAYFGLYSFFFSYAIINNINDNFIVRRLARYSILFSLITILLPFSRSAWISFSLSFLFIIHKKFKFKEILKFLIIFISFFIIIFTLFTINEDSIFYKFNSYLNDIFGGLNFLLNLEVSDKAQTGFITGRIDHGWLNALNVWYSHPIIGDLKQSLNLFIGDGGYTESLANHGLIGLISIVIFFFILWYKPFLGNKISINDLEWLKLTFRSFVIVFIFSMSATGFLRERSIELLPVMFATLISIVIYKNPNKNTLINDK